jgi:hypothetical protein
MPQLLVLVDATESDKPLLEISRQAMRSDFTLLLAWSPQVGRRRLASRHRRVCAAVVAPFATAALLKADGAASPSLPRRIASRRRLATSRPSRRMRASRLT